MTSPPDEKAVRAAVLEALLEVAPDIDPTELDAAQPLRAQVDFDSMDQLNFVTALHLKLGVDVPESDYASLGAIDGAVRYLAERLRVSVK
jgi:acyl carrier protein